MPYLIAARPFRRFTPASQDQLNLFPHTYKSENRGSTGGIKTTVPGTFHHLDKMFLETMQKHGVPFIPDAYGGNVCVVDYLDFHNTMDQHSHLRIPDAGLQVHA